MEQKDSPNENPSKQLQVISLNLIDSLRVVLSMLEYGPLSTYQTPPSPEDIARCATLHLLEALKHIHHNEIGLARTSFEQSAQLLNVFDEAVQE